MNTFQDWLLWLLGSTCRLEPYHTASARPAPPALIHGKTLVASPVAVAGALTCLGGGRVRHLPIDGTATSVSGEPFGVSAILTSFVRSWPPAPLSSRKVRLPFESGVP